jgi:8-oxo-dGTP pyrophosphatase MutT (NUDIX family)
MVTRIDPEVLPPDPEFESQRGPAVAPAELTREALRKRFARLGPPSPAAGPRASQDKPAWTVDQDNDGAFFRPGEPLRPAAVLIGLVGRPEGARLLFTRRAAHLTDHAGQISFPGGRVEASDAGAAGAALREAQEEIGLDPGRVEVLGTLPPYRTISGYEVTPVVGWIDAAIELRADPLEVDEFFEVPAAFLMDGAHHQRRLVIQGQFRRTVYAMDVVGEAAGGARRYLIWGATAAMLRNFYRFLLAAPAEGAQPLQSPA